HRKYKKNRDVFEWFIFSDEEIKKILFEDFENPDITEIKFLNYKIESGKYKDRFLVTMFTVDEIYHVNRIKNIYTDFWCEN
ncbi:hypothetical protein, partial [Salmonella enterica]|uniref:hypothetical protein n=1 Tax=Salmonella enterica TaxID=28901 RepID=UPI003EDB8F94